MSDKHVRKSGDFAAVGAGSIWQLRDGTAAEPPTTGETIVLDRSVEITNWHSPETDLRDVVMENRPEVTVVPRGVTSLRFQRSNRFVCDGVLRFEGHRISCLAESECLITEDSVLEMRNAYIQFAKAARIENHGTVWKGPNDSAHPLQFTETEFESADPHWIGTVLGQVYVRTQVVSGRSSHQGIKCHGKMDVDGLNMLAYANSTLTADLGNTDVRIGTLTFRCGVASSENDVSGIVTLIQNGRFALTGDVVLLGDPVGEARWNTGSDAVLTFSGTADQAITMPGLVAGQTWVVDKSAGVLDLVRFDGYLQGRVRKLYVRASSRIDLSGLSPCLQNFDGDWTVCHGLMGDGPMEGAVPGPAESIRKSMELCENYGRIVIPAGRSLRAGILKNHIGASLEGDGTIHVRYGGLTNSGSIDPALTILYFDLPVHAELDAAETAYSNVPFVVDIRGSVGERFQLDWGDGSSTMAAEPGELTHYYAEAFRTSSSTPKTEVADGNGGTRWVARAELTLTAWNAEGTADSVTKTIFLESQPVSLDFTATPSSGYAPLTVTVDVDSAEGRLFTYDWGTGQQTGPTESPSAQHVYFQEGFYAIRVTAENSERVTLTASKPITVLPDAPRPKARLAITPWEGDIPHEVTASAAGSDGISMSLDWGDGTDAVPVQPDVELVHRYENAGRFLATLTVLNEQDVSVTASQVVNVEDPTTIRAALDIRPSTGIAPLTVLADASDSVGNSFTFTWGDGTSTGPQPASTATHTFDRPGYYPVILTVAKNGETTSISAGVVVLLTPPYPTEQIIPSPLGPVELDRRTKYHGIPRGNMPFPYRYALAQGDSFMKDALQLFCPMNESGRALEGGSALFLGRVTHADGRPVSPTEIASASYTVYRLDDSDASVRIPVEGHENVSLDVENVLLEDTVTDENWVFDELGYNFHHVPDDTLFSPFPTAGRNYLVAYTLRPEATVPKILIQYRVRVV